MRNFEQQISQRVHAFVSEIAELARQQALETLSQALAAGASATGSANGSARRGPRGPYLGRDKGGGRRSPSELAHACELLHAEIQSHPGLRMEQIGAALGAPTRELTLPIRKLLRDKKIRTEGQRRATRYFPADGAASRGRPSRKKAGRRGAKRRKAAASA